MSVKSLKYVLAISVVLVMSVVCHKVNADTNGLTEEVFSTYEVQPQYPGGGEAMMAFISDNIEYPRECVEQGIEGRVICRLTIDSKGKVVDAMVVRGVSEALDKEAVRVAKRMPAFTPAKNSNKAVACYFMVPFMFKLK